MLTLESAEISASDARRLVSTYVTGYCPHLDAGTVALVVGELLSNAQRHTRGGWQLVIRHSARVLSVGVRDADPRPPVVLPLRLDGSGGLGMRIMRSLSDHFTIRGHDGGKTVTALWRLAGA
ncbi:ATP-binding protein [Streptomyces sp. 8L]|uniref:ATP-binding protein n=1 Tax=Streptomyces sp. 8L TaxID=2877242 RepID=UPI001CD41DBC|nr:ATP-binding protein [Streptomyces sp. 8L]MCA1222156.1 ATP-binding protein [Streptomyces sp. 8L]